MSSSTDSIDWMRVVVHGLFGAGLGVILGLSLLALTYPAVHPAVAVGVPTLIVALVAAIWGDRFWEWLKESSWWNPFTWV